VVYILTGALKATGLAKATASGGDAVQRCGAADAPALEAEIGALIRQAGDSLRGPPADAPETIQTAQSSGRAPDFERLPTDQVGVTVARASAWDHKIGTGGRDDDLRFRAIMTTGVLLDLSNDFLSSR
jgi:hypothetical protein